MSEWQPIETAPRGRKVIAGYFNPLGNWRSVMARFYAERTLPASDDSDDEFAPPGWYEESETHDEILRMAEPSHWMPLPKPPAGP